MELSSGIDVDAVVAGAQQGDGTVRSIDFEGLVVVQIAQADVEAALANAELRHAVVEVEKLDGGLGAEANRGGTDVHFGAGILVGPEVIAGGHRIVERGLRPFLDAAGTE